MQLLTSLWLCRQESGWIQAAYSGMHLPSNPKAVGLKAEAMGHHAQEEEGSLGAEDQGTSLT